MSKSARSVSMVPQTKLRKNIETHYQLQPTDATTCNLQDPKAKGEHDEMQTLNAFTDEASSGLLFKTILHHIDLVPFFAIDRLATFYRRHEEDDRVLRLHRASLRKFDHKPSQRKATTYVQIGDICGKKGLFQDSAEALTHALDTLQALYGESNPQFVSIACHMAGYLSLAGDFETAETWYKRIRQSDLQREGGGDELALAVSFMSLLRAYHSDGRLSAAGYLLELHPGDAFDNVQKFYGAHCAAHTQWIAGLVSGQVGQHNIAEDHFRDAWRRGLSRKDVPHEQFHFALGWACFRIGKIDDARDQVSKALDAASTSEIHSGLLKLFSEEADRHQHAMRWEDASLICRFALDLPMYTVQDKKHRLQLLECLEWSLLSSGELRDAEEISNSRLAFLQDMDDISSARRHYLPTLCLMWQAKYVEAMELLLRSLTAVSSQDPTICAPTNPEGSKAWCDEALDVLHRVIENEGGITFRLREPPVSGLPNST